MTAISNDNLVIRRLGTDDVMIAEKLIHLFKNAFNNDHATVAAKPSYLKTLLKRSSFVCFAAVYENEVIGGLTAYELPMYYSEYTDLFIYDIAVHANFRRMGIGKRLMDT